MGEALTLSGFSRNCTMFTKDAKVRLGLRTIVEAKHGDDGAGELHGAAPRCRRAGLDGEAKLFGKVPNQLHGGGIGRMACVELGASEAPFAPDVRGFERLLAPADDRYGEAA